MKEDKDKDGVKKIEYKLYAWSGLNILYLFLHLSSSDSSRKIGRDLAGMEWRASSNLTGLPRTHDGWEY